MIQAVAGRRSRGSGAAAAPSTRRSAQARPDCGGRCGCDALLARQAEMPVDNPGRIGEAVLHPWDVLERRAGRIGQESRTWTWLKSPVCGATGRRNDWAASQTCGMSLMPAMRVTSGWTQANARRGEPARLTGPSSRPCSRGPRSLAPRRAPQGWRAGLRVRRCQRRAISRASSPIRNGAWQVPVSSTWPGHPKGRRPRPY
jgi:hypothetical protein